MDTLVFTIACRGGGQKLLETCQTTMNYQLAMANVYNLAILHSEVVNHE